MYEQPYNPYAKNIAAVKEFFKTPATLILGIAQALGAVLSLIGSILFAANAKEIFLYLRDYILYSLDKAANTGNQSGINEAKNWVADLFEKLDPSSLSSSLGSSIPSLIVTGLIAAAFFIIFFKSRNQEPNATPMTGFTILYVFSIISLVVMILAMLGVFAIVGLLFVIYAKISSDPTITSLKDLPILGDLMKEFPNLEKEMNVSIAGNSNDAAIVFLVLGIVFAVVAVIAFFFILFTAINKMRYYKSVKTSLSSVELQNKGAAPYGVMCILSAIGTGSSLLSSFSMLFAPKINGRSNPMLGIAVISVLSLAASFVALVMEAKLALGYKKYINNIKFSYNAPAGPTAPYSPFVASGGYFAPQNNAPQVNPYMPPAPPAAPSDNTVDSRSAVLDSLFGEVVNDDAPQDAPAEPAEDIVDTEAVTEEILPDIPEEAPADAAVPTCPVCGAEVDPDAPFCGNCGNRL